MAYDRYGNPKKYERASKDLDKAWKHLQKAFNPRKVQAAAQRADRERQRRANQLQRLHHASELLLSRLSAESQRDLLKVVAFEEKIMHTPVRTLDLCFNEQGQWVCKPLVDRTGKIQFSIAPAFVSDAVAFSPHSVEFDGQQITPLACCLSPYGTFFAFSITSASASPKRRRLVNKSAPEKSSIVVVADEQAFYPLDGDADGTAMPQVRRTCVVAFEPFVSPVQEFELAFVRPPTKREPAPEPVKIKVTGASIAETIKKLGFLPSLVDQFRGLIEPQLQSVTTRVRSSLAHQSRETGCLFSTLMMLVSSGVVVSLVWCARKLF